MVERSLYKVSSDDLVSFSVKKFDQDFNLETVYSVSKGRPRWTCTCPQGYRRPNEPCRHVSIVKVFEDNKKVNSGYFLEWELYGLERAWVKPNG